MKRLESLLPLLAAYFGLATLYAWQAWQRKTVTLFSDEIEFTQVSRSIADTGRAALRGGEPALEFALYPYLAAPAWWLNDVSDSFGVVKLLGVLLMTSAIFPAYGLARLVVPRSYALFAAVATAAAPALSYSPFLVDEPLAYPVSTLTLYLIARAGLRPTRGSVAWALAACAAAFFVRSQLAVLFVILALVFAARAWRHERFVAWRQTWTRGDWVGAITLTVGLAVGASALIGHRSNTWYVSTGFFKERMLDYGLWAAGALAIGIGVLPLIGALAALVRPRGEAPDPGRRVFADLSLASFAAFGVYTAVKAAFISTTLAIVIAERNLMYLYPLLFAGTALLLHRRRRVRLGARGRDGVRAVPRHDDAVHARAVPELRGARARDRRLREPDPEVAGRDDRDHARAPDTRVGGGAGPAPVRTAPRRRPGGGRPRCADAGLEPDHRDLRRQRRARRVRPDLRQPPEAARLDPANDGERLHDLSSARGSMPSRPGRSSSGIRTCAGSGAWTAAHRGRARERRRT